MNYQLSLLLNHLLLTRRPGSHQTNTNTKKYKYKYKYAYKYEYKYKLPNVPLACPFPHH